MLLHLMVLLFLTFAPVISAGPISNGLVRVFKERGRANILITMREDLSSFEIAKSITSEKSQSREARLKAVVHALQAKALRSQRKVVRILGRKRVQTPLDYQVLWLSNQIIVRGADRTLVEKLARVKNVIGISEETFIKISSPLLDQHKGNESITAWGVERIQAPLVWESGIRGAGMIVGVIDTGVRLSHEAIRRNYVGESNHGWFDPGKKSPIPSDDHGHGTHCTGTILGLNGIGVAPEAKWMACKGCEGSLCSSFHLIQCFQFMTCPTDPFGRTPDCSKAPHIVSNSWGGGRNLEFSRATSALQQAGIILVFAAGNRGPGCGTLDSPGDYESVITVGATTEEDEVSSFSASGPTWESRIKPDIVAPGTRILSASHSSDNSYSTLDGTSMACPHVAGIVALILSATPDLTPAQVKQILWKSTDPIKIFSDCDGGGNGTIPTYPNHRGGYGRINARKAVENSILKVVS